MRNFWKVKGKKIDLKDKKRALRFILIRLLSPIRHRGRHWGAIRRTAQSLNTFFR